VKWFPQWRWDVVAKLANQTPAPRKVVEVGVWIGDMSSHCMPLIEDLEEYWMIDKWKSHPGKEKVGAMQGHIRPQGKRKRGWPSIKRLALMKTKKFPQRRVLQMWSLEAAGRFKDGSMSLVFIDGDHRLNAVTADIKAWLPKVMAGGILAGHDYNMKSPGVVKAVWQELEKKGYELHLEKDHVWWVCV
jgi:hypothetical protein